MGSFAPSASFPDPHGVTPRVQAPAHDPNKQVAKEPGPAAKAAAERLEVRKAEISDKVLPDLLIVEHDEAAGRFVQTVLDDQTQEVVMRYPRETQLTFSRAVAAYTKAMRES